MDQETLESNFVVHVRMPKHLPRISGPPRAWRVRSHGKDNIWRAQLNHEELEVLEKELLERSAGCSIRMVYNAGGYSAALHTYVDGVCTVTDLELLFIDKELRRTVE